ncbi:MAG: ABC transporter permease subunit [Planctomycetota bacterium]|nr:ABC transporter permease subunit [Planctomycetota bacterium]
MLTAKIQSVLRFLSLTWLTGPVFGKELRIVSRRRRHYLLRFAYLAMLSIFVVITWISVVEYSGGTAASRYKMSDAGKAIVGTISWFQFLALQLIAVILMSTSISEEVRNGTLGVLMTTPVTSLQIVAGKLLSKLLHLTILLLISLPLLAIVRVFGGVPLGYVIGSGCITLTAAMFAGAIAMFFSTIFRKAYASILLTLAVGFVLHFLLPSILSMFMMVIAIAGGGESIVSFYVHINPFASMMFYTMEMANSGRAGGLWFFWPVHCLFMLVLTGVIVMLCVRLVRRASVKKAFSLGRAVRVSTVAVAPPAPMPMPVVQAAATMPPAFAAPLAPPPIPAQVPTPPTRTVIIQSKPIRRITGSPIVWKKLRAPMLPGKILRIIAIILTLGLILLTYSLVGALGGLKYAEAHASYGVIFVLLGIVTTAVFAATSISSEKESRTLPILLTTPLGDWHIIGASVLEVLRRSLPIWLFLVGHMLIFTLVGYLHPIILLHILMLIVWLVAFLTGTGLYFSSRFKRTTPAVVMNLGLALAIWAVIPWVVSIATWSASGPNSVSELIKDPNPLFQAGILATGAGAREFNFLSGDEVRQVPEYDWASGPASATETTGFMFLFLLAYAAIGYLFLWRAKVRLRRNLF